MLVIESFTGMKVRLQDREILVQLQVDLKNCNG